MRGPNKGSLGGPGERAVYYCSVSRGPDLTPVHRIRSWLAAFACVAFSLPALAESFGDLYSVTVPYTGENETAFREGMKALRVSGAAKVAAGITTPEEILKVTPPAFEA